MKTYAFVAIVVCAITASRSHADLNSYYVYSLEWLVDSSDFIVEATVVRGKDAATKTHVTRIEKVDRFIRPGDGKFLPAIAGLSDAITAPGSNKVLLFATRNPKKGFVELTYCIFLTKHHVPAEAAKRTEYYQSCLPSHTSAWQPLSFYANACLAIDKNGDILVDPAKVVAAVDKRMALKLPLLPVSEGRYVRRCHLLSDDMSDYNLLVPPEPEIKKAAPGAMK